MTPDFDELVGEADSPEEREELRAVHELLVSASPPPFFEARPRRARAARTLLPRPWVLGAAGAVAAAAVVGLLVFSPFGAGTRGSFVQAMHGVGSAPRARASIDVGREDANGNRPLRMTVDALPALPHGAWYVLYLTEKGKPLVVCGSFRTNRAGMAQVAMNAPADLGEYDGWIVTSRVPGTPSQVLLST